MAAMFGQSQEKSPSWPPPESGQHLRGGTSPILCAAWGSPLPPSGPLVPSHHRGLGQAAMVFALSLREPVVPARVQLGEHVRWARPGDHRSLTPLLILSKDASPRGRAGSAQTSKGLHGWCFDGSLVK